MEAVHRTKNAESRNALCETSLRAPAGLLRIARLVPAVDHGEQVADLLVRVPNLVVHDDQVFGLGPINLEHAEHFLILVRPDEVEPLKTVNTKMKVSTSSQRQQRIGRE